MEGLRLYLYLQLIVLGDLPGAERNQTSSL